MRLWFGDYNLKRPAKAIASAIPSSEGLVDARIWISRRFLAGQLLFHALHPGTEAVLASAALGLWRLEARLAGVVPIVGCPPLGVQTAIRVLAFLALPGGGLCHHFFFLAAAMLSTRFG